MDGLDKFSALAYNFFIFKKIIALIHIISAHACSRDTIWKKISIDLLKINILHSFFDFHRKQPKLQNFRAL